MSLAIPTGSHIGHFFARPYWAARLKDGEWRSEIDGHDWPEDASVITQLWLFGAKVVESDPQGNSAYLMSVPDTELFQEKGEHLHLIGRKEEQTGIWTGFVWDTRTQQMRLAAANWKQNAS